MTLFPRTLEWLCERTVEDNYRRELHKLARMVWEGVDYFVPVTDLWNYSAPQAVSDYHRRAWIQGAKEVGFSPADFTPADNMALAMLQVGHTSRLPDLYQWIVAHDKAHGGDINVIFSRLDLWVNALEQTQSVAKERFGSDKKLKWELGATEKHCASCLKLNGHVHRASQWQAADVRPQSPSLECGGWRCDCSLEVTDEPCTPGPVPSIP